MNRLYIASLTLGDRDAVTEMLQDPQVMKHLGPKRALTDQEANEWFIEALNNPSRCVFKTVNTDELVGFCGVKELNGVPDFGYFIRRKFWGQGLATEACQMVIHQLSQNRAIDELDVFIARENIASLRLAQKLSWKRGEQIIRDTEIGYLFQLT